MLEELNGDFLQWLRGFYYVAKTGSVRKAAEIMNRHPSTISYQIKSLEKELGTVLFDRYKKSLRITQDGRNLLSWTISTFETLQSMRSSVGSAQGDLRGYVHIAATLPMITMAVCAISAFTRQHPGVNLVIDRGISCDVLKSVTESEVDFGLLPVTSAPMMDHFESLITARLLLVAHKNNPWNIPEEPRMEDLKNLPYVCLSQNALEDTVVWGTDPNLSLLRDYILKNAVIQINNYHLVMRFIWNMLGVGIMDELCFQASNYGADWDDLFTLPLNHLLPDRMYGILTRCHKHISPQANAFMDVIRGYFKSLDGVNDLAAWGRIRHIL